MFFKMADGGCLTAYVRMDFALVNVCLDHLTPLGVCAKPGVWTHVYEAVG